MALEKKTLLKSFTYLPAAGILEVQESTAYYNDGVIDSNETYHRYTYDPLEPRDPEEYPEVLQALNALHTPEVKAAFKIALDARNKELDKRSKP
jgi:hypothetical protein